MPIPLGVLAVAGAGAAGAASSFDLLQTTLITTNTSSVTFSNLNNYSAYKHLQLRITARSTASQTRILMRMNGVTSGSYAAHSLRGNGSVVTSGAATSETSMRLWFWTPGTDIDAANIFSAGVVDILDFSSSSKNTTVRNINGYHGTGFQQVSLNSGLFNNTAALTSIELFLESSASFVSGSRLSLYGIK